MRQHPRICAGLALAAFAAIANATPIIVNDAGDAGPGNCATTCTLRDAIASAHAGDTISFTPGLHSPITLTKGEMLIGTALTITGPGAAALTISAGSGSRIFIIAAATTITDITIADGMVIGNNGGNGTDGTGAAGGSGESEGGACVLVDSGIAVVLDHVAITHCRATGGGGGTGGQGAPGVGTQMGGQGGSGGSGGDAVGAAIASYGSLSLLDSSVVDAHATGGSGGAGGAGGSGLPPGLGGQGGVGGAALGGAVAARNGGSLRIFNSTIAASSGNGGGGGSAGSGTSGPPGGVGGYAAGGLLYVDNGVALADLEFSTLANGSVAGGSGYIAGTPVANAINAGSTLNVLSSVVVGAQGNADLCYGPITAAAGSVNLSETTSNTVNPSSCNNFSLNATLAQTLKPIDASATPAYMPIWKSPAIDAAANCQDIAGQPVTTDQHDTPRPQPQGGACDLGAIEADYIFVDGFGG